MRFFSVIIFSLFLIEPTYADDKGSAIHLDEHPWFSIRLPRVFECLVLNRAQVDINHFFASSVDVKSSCKAKQAQDGCLREGKMMPLIYWQEEKEIILFEPQEKEAPYTDLLHSRRTWKLGRDTVKTIEQIHGSSYLETENDWQQQRKKTLKGKTYTITRSKIHGLSESCQLMDNN